MTKFDQPFPDYELLDRVGGGAMGTVFKARHKRLNRIVALKILKPSLARDKRYVDRLRREARIVASLSHPHIVTGYDLGEESGYHFFVMEFVEGKSLRQLLVEWGMFAEEYVLRVAREVAEALDHAYQRDVIHRDIKPANILIDESGSVKLTDMGLAKGPADLTLTRDGATVGTPMYISPEQARNPQDVDVRSDLYSLGATIYHMATGVPPFAGDTMAELITNVLNEDVVPPNEANSAVSAGLSLVIRKLLTKNLAVRYQTPRELLDDLDRLDQELPPSVDAARLEASVERRGRWLRPTVAVASAAALAVGAWWLGRQMVEPTQSAPSSEQFLAALDQELVALPSPGARFERLREVTEEPPGTVQELERRRVQVAAQLQATLDLVIGELEGPRRDALEAWLRDPLVWPDASQFERERLLPSVRKSCGVELGQLPARIRRDRVDALRQSVAQSLERRDAELLARFDHYLSGAIAGQAISSARRGEFAAAAQSWAAARSTFCDGVGRPLPERLAAPLRDALDERLRAASQAALQSLAQAEQAVVRAMRGYVSTTLAAIQASMAERDAGPDLAAQSLRRLRTSLDHYWPRAASFRLGRDPWPEVEQQLNAAEQEIELRRDERRARRFEARCDTAWHVYVHGDADSALAVLDGAEPATSQQRRVLEGHVRCLRAAQRVEQAVYRAIAAQASRGPIAFRAGSAEPYALRVEPAGERLRLYGEAVDQPARAMRLTELRVGALLSDLGPLQAVASGPRQLGVAVLGLAADDGDGVGAAIEALPESDRGFVLDAVAPRLRRARGDRPRPTPVDVESMFRMLDEALAEVDRGGSPRELTRALLRLESRPKLSLTSAQERRLRAAQQRRELVIREANLLADLRADAPRGARPTVRVEDGALVGSVSFPAAALRPGAGDGWQLREDVLEFAGGGRPFEELAQLGLRADPGERLLGKRTRLEFEAVFPGHVVGDRSYLLEFDGVSLVLVLGADDSVQVELVDGAALDEARARRAYATALTGVFAPARASAIPGAAHRVVVDVVQVAPSQASVKVTFEDRELLRELHGFDPKRRPRAALFPRQELGVRKLTISAFDL